MSTEFKEIADIARSSLMPDFFAVRIEEEELYPQLQQLIAKIKLPQPLPQLDRIKQLAAAAPNATAFVEELKSKNLWSTLRELLSRIKVS